MDHKRIAKQLMEFDETVFEEASCTMTPPQDKSEIVFFRFVDKNPLYPDNSKEAIQAYIRASRKRRYDFKTHFDEDCAKAANYLISNHLHHRNK